MEHDKVNEKKHIDMVTFGIKKSGDEIQELYQ